MSTHSIPEKDFLLFKACNSAASWRYKQDFYYLKSSILLKHGLADGFDLQVIEKKCFRCYPGSPTAQSGCSDCVNGIYSTSRVALARFILNGSVFHRPVALVTSDGSIVKTLIYEQSTIKKLNIPDKFTFKETIQGLVVHAFSSVLNVDYAYFILLWKFSASGFLSHIESFFPKWREAYEIILKAGSVRAGLAAYFKVNPDNYTDDLPAIGTCPDVLA